MLRRSLAVVVGVALALGLAGCVDNTPIPVPTAKELVGTWHSGDTTLRLDDDGAFFLTSVPEGVVKQSEPDAAGNAIGKEVDVSGGWSVVAKGGNDAGGVPGVQLDFTHPATIGPFNGLTLLVGGYTAKTRTLYVFLGRPDSDHEFQLTR